MAGYFWYNVQSLIFGCGPWSLSSAKNLRETTDTTFIILDTANEQNFNSLVPVWAELAYLSILFVFLQLSAQLEE